MSGTLEQRLIIALHAAIGRERDGMLADPFWEGDRQAAEVRARMALREAVDTVVPPVRVRILRPDDERVLVEIGGEVVASANHDEHGWSGMDAVVATALAVARAAGLPVEDAESS